MGQAFAMLFCRVVFLPLPGLDSDGVYIFANCGCLMYRRLYFLTSSGAKPSNRIVV